MKTETTEFFKVARKQPSKHEEFSRLKSWENHARSGKALKNRVKSKDEFKLF